MTTPLHWQLENRYHALPRPFHAPVAAAAFPAPRLVIFNDALARDLGLLRQGETPDPAALAPYLVGNRFPPGAAPIAQAYAGHQFGHFTRLGDGRATLIGEQRTPDGRLIDIQLKGNGQTAWSRRGDGRAALAPMLREYLISEAMHALGIPTTRSLAVATTGDTIARERPLPGAVLTRTAQSHIRVGTFEYAAAFASRADLQTLAEFTRARHFPHLDQHDTLALYRAIIARQAALIAKWQLTGFVHGVMNTDNMTASGETLDYGPCAFLDAYHPATVFSSIDHQGRYRYEQQPAIAQWNLARLAEALLPLIADHPEQAVALASHELAAFIPLHASAWLDGMRAKLGLANAQTCDQTLADDLLRLMHTYQADYTNTFVRLTLDALGQHDNPLPGTQTLFSSDAFAEWRKRWQARQPDAALMQTANPFIIPRNHHVEHALHSAENGDMRPFHTLLNALQRPHAHDSAHRPYQHIPPADQPYRTFCGT